MKDTIYLKIKIENGKIETEYNDRLVTINDVSLLFYEFEKIKKELIDKKFDCFEVRKE